jgi:hypothetical protein
MFLTNTTNCPKNQGNLGNQGKVIDGAIKENWELPKKFAAFGREI